jgi:lipoate synthase
MLLKKKLDTGMSDLMAKHNNNIAEFNAEVNETMQKLQSRGVGDLVLLGQLLRSSPHVAPTRLRSTDTSKVWRIAT